MPIPLRTNMNSSGDLSEDLSRNEPIAIGTRAQLFHFASGYSLPLAVQSSRRLREIFENKKGARARWGKFLNRQIWQQKKICFLNRLFFAEGGQDKRYRFYERFFELPEKAAQRFMNSKFSYWDFFQILFAKRPPVSLAATLRELR